MARKEKIEREEEKCPALIKKGAKRRMNLKKMRKI
jgi:hypothetical protein